MCISNELYCFEVKQTNPVELHTQALSAQRRHGKEYGTLGVNPINMWYIAGRFIPPKIHFQNFEHGTLLNY